MSKHNPHQKDSMSELADLEARMRQSRPQITPMSPVTKRRLRAQLLENRRMNKMKLNIGGVAIAVSLLILFIGLPLYFWLTLSSLNGNVTTSQPESIGVQATATEVLLIDPTSTVISLPTSQQQEEASTSEPMTATAVPTTLPTATVTLPREPIAEASIVQIGDPVETEIEGSGAPPGTFFSVPIEVAYTLQGYEEAILFIDYTLVEANGVSGGKHKMLLLPAEAGQNTAEVILNNSYILPDGGVDPDTVFELYINVYDAELAQYVNVFPGDLELPPDELSMAYPYFDPAGADVLELNTITISGMTSDQIELSLSLTANVRSDSEGELTAIIHDDNNELATQTIPVTQESDTINLAFTLANQTSDAPLTVSVTLAVGDTQLTATETVPLAELMATEPNSIQLMEITAEPVGNSLVFTAIVGYQINEPYSSGTMQYHVSYVLPDDASSGGGGGGGNTTTLPAGLNMTVIEFRLTDDNLTVDNWESLLTIEFVLTGIEADGGQSLLDIAVLSPEAE